MTCNSPPLFWWRRQQTLDQATIAPTIATSVSSDGGVGVRTLCGMYVRTFVLRHIPLPLLHLSIILSFILITYILYDMMTTLFKFHNSPNDFTLFVSLNVSLLLYVIPRLFKMYTSHANVKPC